MKKAVLAALLLAGCQTNAEIADRRAQERLEIERTCRLSLANGNKQSMAECVAETYRAYEILSRYTLPTAQAPASPVYYPQAPVSGSDAPALPNILPPTVRCQSVPAGLGTVQTVCR